MPVSLSIERAFIYPGEYRVWNGDQTSFQYHFLAQGELKIDDLSLKRGAGLARAGQLGALQSGAAG